MSCHIRNGGENNNVLIYFILFIFLYFGVKIYRLSINYFFIFVKLHELFIYLSIDTL